MSGLSRGRSTPYAVTICVFGAVTFGCGGDSASGGAVASQSEAASALCPLVWDFVKSVGDSFNEAASWVMEADDPHDRRRIWTAAFDEIEHRTLQLGDEVAVWANDPILEGLVAEIERDVPKAIEELVAIRTMFTEHPEIDEQSPQQRTQQVIVRLEKVIELPKPDLNSSGAGPALIASFQAVPSCQHSVRGANDGTARANG